MHNNSQPFSPIHIFIVIIGKRKHKLKTYEQILKLNLFQSPTL